jgi:hypothetical protein
MPQRFKFSRRIARLRAPVLVALAASFVGCNSTDSFTPDTTVPTTNDPATGTEQAGVQATPVDNTTLASASWGGGIPFGTFAQPTGMFGNLYSGAMQNNWPDVLLKELSAIKSRGGKVILMFAGSQQLYKDGAGHFSMTKWKARIDRFRHVNFSSYVNDGTIVGHYLIDEPQDASNWNGVPVNGAQVEEMAKYSKSIWPSMTTIVRAEPSKLPYSGGYRYLDTGWAQYTVKRGNINDFIRQNVADAQRAGLGLVVGLNLIRGGNNHGRMTADQVKTFGSALLSSSYPCAFISWQYNSTYLSSSSMKSAMAALRSKSENRASRSCKG